MHAAYIQAAAPEPFQVLGKKLLPFTVGHQLLMERFECAYAVSSKTDPTYQDFIFAIWLCSRSYAKALKQLNSRWTIPKIRFWSWLCGNYNIPEAQAVFSEYMESHTSEPMYFVEDSGASCDEIQIPWGVFLMQHTQERIGINDKAAVDYPYKQANLLYLRHLAEKSVIKFATKRDHELQEAARRAA